MHMIFLITIVFLQSLVHLETSLIVFSSNIGKIVYIRPPSNQNEYVGAFGHSCIGIGIVFLRKYECYRAVG